MFAVATYHNDLTFLFVYSYFLWSVSKPGKSGVPTVDLSGDENIHEISGNLNSTQAVYERLIKKVFKKMKGLKKNITNKSKLISRLRFRRSEHSRIVG